MTSSAKHRGEGGGLDVATVLGHRGRALLGDVGETAVVGVLLLGRRLGLDGLSAAFLGTGGSGGLGLLGGRQLAGGLLGRGVGVVVAALVLGLDLALHGRLLRGHGVGGQSAVLGELLLDGGPRVGRAAVVRHAARLGELDVVDLENPCQRVWSESKLIGQFPATETSIWKAKRAKKCRYGPYRMGWVVGV